MPAPTPFLFLPFLCTFSLRLYSLLNLTSQTSTDMSSWGGMSEVTVTSLLPILSLLLPVHHHCYLLLPTVAYTTACTAACVLYVYNWHLTAHKSGSSMGGYA